MGHVSTAVAILRSTTHGPAWHGDPVMEILRRMNADQAARRLMPSAHSAWEILNHMIAWQEHTARMCEGGGSTPLEGEADWPPVSISGEAAWTAAVERFQKSADHLIQIVSGWTEAQLAHTVQGRDFTFKVLVHGIAHHNLYHSGQIGLIIAGMR